MKRVLVGTDGSSAAAGAVQWAVSVCEVAGAELVLASAVSVATGMELRPGVIDVLCRDVRERLEGPWSEPVRRAGVPHRTLLLEGDPRQQLVRAAANEDADLVAIGAIGAGGGYSGLGLGGSAHYLVHHAGRPLAAVRTSGGPLRGGHVVVGVDGSAACEPAVRWAIEFARSCGGSVLAVYAYDPLADSYPHPPIENWRYRGEDRARTQVEGAAADAAVELQLRLHGAHPVTALNEAAEDVDASIIVAGTRGRGGFHGLLAGRVPVQLLHHAVRPVIVVPHL